MIRPVLVGLALAIGVSAAIAQSDPIAERRATMKGVGAATAQGNRMAKGEAPFELDKAQEVLKTYAAAADKMHTYFPESAKSGGETTASPKIWENQAEFRKRFDDWAADIKKAAANTKDLDTFKAEFATVTRACGGCHQAFRVSRS
ncbi:MAG TPA: cytochrome c [Microvirga sp.]|jgi:cytochrome c556|nr:cytochrome c [Microvirga sp.]